MGWQADPAYGVRRQGGAATPLWYWAIAPGLSAVSIQSDVAVLLRSARRTLPSHSKEVTKIRWRVKMGVMRALTLLIVLALALSCWPGRSEQFYCSTNGTAKASGSQADPWDLPTAIGPNTKLQGGDTLWLLPGTYQGNFQSYLLGKEGASITVRSTPHGLARIDGIGETYPLVIRGGHTIYRDLEIIQSSTWRTNAETPVAVQCVAPHIKLINLIIHDAGQGIGSWMDAHAMEAYGCLIYYNGLRPLEHGVYTQNDAKTGIKRYEDNIIFNNSGFGVHAYTKGGQLTGFEFTGNIIFNNGTKRGPGEHLDNLFVGGAPPADQITARSNYCVFTRDSSRFNMRFSYQNHQANPHGKLLVADNVLVGGTALVAEDWRQITFTNNLVYSAGGFALLRPPSAVKLSDYLWDDNRYFGAAHFNAGQPQTFAQWVASAHLDRKSIWSATPIQAAQVMVRPNRYEPNRAHIAVLNWPRTNVVAVNVSEAIKPGTIFELKNAQDYFGVPVLRGVYEGGPLLIPMTNLTTALPKGPVPAPESTGPFFNVFILRPAMGP